jgi:hypothetical protein
MGAFAPNSNGVHEQARSGTHACPPPSWCGSGLLHGPWAPVAAPYTTRRKRPGARHCLGLGHVKLQARVFSQGARR